MSLTTSRRVWKDTPDTIRGGAYTVLLALADYATEQGICWPTLRQIAAKARIEERQTTTLVRKLEREGQIVVARKAGRGGGLFIAILTGLNREQKMQTLHLFNEQKVQFTALKGAICADQKVQSVQTTETAFDAPLSAETPIDAQCNDHKRRSVTKTSPNGEAPAVSATPPQPDARNPSTPRGARPPSPPLATATPTPAAAGQVPAEIEQPRLVEADVPDPVDVYREVCEVKRPNQAQRDAIRAAVTGYPDEWRRVCATFRQNAWNVRNVGNLLDAYGKAVVERRKVEARQAETERQRRVTEAAARQRPATDE
jgi:hypothetical protein